MQTASNTQSGTKNPVDVAIYDASGNQITSFGGGSGGTASTDDAAFTIGSAASITPAGFLADETATDSVDEGDAGIARMTLTRKQLMVISDYNSETHADVLALTNSHPIAVALVDANGDQLVTVGITSVVPGTGATNLGKAEDAAHSSGDVGAMVLAVRNDTRGTLAGTNLDYAPLQLNSDGDLRVSNHVAGYRNATFSVNHAPAANTKATIAQAAGGAGIKNVCTGFTVSLAAQTTAPAAIQVSVALIDGATGGTTYLWGPQVISLPATAGAMAAFVRSNVFIVGTANTAMTLEFSAAGGANTIETVSFEGTTTV